MAWVSAARPRFGVDNGWLLFLAAAIIGGSSALAVAVAQPKVALIAGAMVVVLGITAMRPRVALYILAAALMVSSGYLKLAGAGVFLVILLWALSQRRRLWQPDTLFTLIGLFALAALIAVATAGTRSGIIGDTLTYAGYLALYWAMITAIDSRRALNELFSWVGVAAVVTALVGLAQYRFQFTVARSQFRDFSDRFAGGDVAFPPPRLIDFQGWAGRFRIESFDGVPDYLAMHMAVVLPFVFYWLIRQKSPTARVIGAAMILILLAALMLTFSRAGMIVVAAMAVIVAFKFGLHRAMPVLLPVVLIVAVVAGGYSPIRTRISSIVTEAQTEQSGLLLTELVPEGLEFMFPLHLAYLLMGIELGAFGLVALLLLLFVTFRWTQRLSRTFKARGDPELWAWTEAAQLALISVMLAGFFYPVFDNFRYFWLLIGVVGVLNRLADKPARTTKQVEQRAA